VLQTCWYVVLSRLPGSHSINLNIIQILNVPKLEPLHTRVRLYTHTHVHAHTMLFIYTVCACVRALLVLKLSVMPSNVHIKTLRIIVGTVNKSTGK